METTGLGVGVRRKHFTNWNSLILGDTSRRETGYEFTPRFVMAGTTNHLITTNSAPAIGQGATVDSHSSILEIVMKSLQKVLVIVLIVTSLGFHAATANAANATWNVLTGVGPFEWTTVANWNPNSTFPNGVGERARFDVNEGTTQTVNLSAAITIGRFDIGDTNSTYRAFTIAPNGGTLTFDNTGSTNAILIKAATGNTVTDNISAPVTLNDSLDITNSATTGGITISGDVSGAGGISKAGVGKATLSGVTNNYGGVTTVNAGTLSITAPGALYNANGSGGWTSTNIIVATGALLDLNYDGTGASSFSDAQVVTLAGLTGYAADSFLGLNTTAGDATLASSVSNTSVVLTKTGTNTLTLSGTNNIKTAVQTGTLLLPTRDALFAGNTANWTSTNFGVSSAQRCRLAQAAPGQSSPLPISPR